ncbi:hypothetical protein BTHERMOSOX_537 [Bathymodiolus thermophilus thioautotrophic gill symbiont]|uniref:Uncharacterized protein n=1 Tax=Bathymodiolus thermophilus thioautotrophic gill symbiont TaxID=2360 RepID=A0A3G3ILC7_9GAMM|nr:hypothetical protein MS2017_0885 [Bathymodiolus thermophilus thioautotrophic gill symbiont]CAB5497795.1 hypothetical protein THERMOT_748 [Bathymodiolus thermophilus thioautotrophic gill symbiont]CAB5501729.1 hypothetical protein THERMOS_1434 [Bathymodiolus thermophilus thioautotrophic gill symbiont]SHA18500.1 hypothetical protein BTHERMOSOX_537 [Bathymodiolus thermophilus thioautotrophic gill symbiont]
MQTLFKWVDKNELDRINANLQKEVYLTTAHRGEEASASVINGSQSMG